MKHKTKHGIGLFWLIACLAVLSGCATLAGPAAPRPGDIQGHGGAPATKAALEKAVAGAQVVLVGEVHDHPAHHRLQLEIIEIMARQKGPLFIGVEWLDEQFQTVCDRLSDGKITPDQFRKQVEWDKRWGYSFDMFRPIFAFAQRPGVRLLALNAPVDTVRKIARQGLEALSPAERARLAPALDLADPAYRKRLELAFAAHGMQGPKMSERFFAAQVARDETMSHRAAARLLPWPESKARAVVLAGGGHVSMGRGIAPRVRRRLPGVRLLTILPATPGGLARLRAREPGRAPADFVVITAPKPRRPFLGVMLAPGPEGLLIKRVFPQTPAQRAGLRAGDLLFSLDGVRLSRAKDIHRAIRRSPFAPHKYKVKRDGQWIEFTISLAKPVSE